uniref:Uncharacterized protein n=1 Tax=Parascaris equorum TaxID=6256 RepID=A0A914RRU8_PAREQ
MAEFTHEVKRCVSDLDIWDYWLKATRVTFTANDAFQSAFNGQVLVDGDAVTQRWNDDAGQLDEQCSSAVDMTHESDDDDLLDVACCTLSPNTRCVLHSFHSKQVVEVSDLIITENMYIT